MKDREVILAEAETITNAPQDVYSKIVQMQLITLGVLLDIRESIAHPVYIHDSEKTTARLKKVLGGCLICGKEHDTKDCPQLDEKVGGSAKTRTAPVPFTPIVSEDDFSKIKLLKDEDMNAVDVSVQLDFPIQQVNFAFQSLTYEDYLRLAKRAK
jgi:hypothetical protein